MVYFIAIKKYKEVRKMTEETRHEIQELVDNEDVLSAEEEEDAMHEVERLLKKEEHDVNFN